MELNNIQEYALRFYHRKMQLQYPFFSPLANALLYEMKNFNGNVHDIEIYQKLGVKQDDIESLVKEFESFDIIVDLETQLNMISSLKFSEEKTLNRIKKCKKLASFLGEIKADGIASIINVILYSSKKRISKHL